MSSLSLYPKEKNKKRTTQQTDLPQTPSTTRTLDAGGPEKKKKPKKKEKN